MKKSIITSIIFFQSIAFLFAQNQDILGEWTGEWSGSIGYYYTFDLTLEENKLGNIHGQFTWKLVKSPYADEKGKLGLKAIEYIEGNFNAQTNQLIVQGVRKDDPDTIIGMDRYDLFLSKNKAVLEGKTDDHGTGKGIFYGIRKVQKPNHLENKSSLEGREIITAGEVAAQEERIVLKFWDNSQEDGDIISLNLNGEWILRNFIVKKTPGEMILNLVEGENILILHAENLGESPPNTAAISITENGERIKRVILNSDMGKSEAIKIIRKKK